MAYTTADFELGTNGNTITTGDAGSAIAWDSVFIGSGNALTYDNVNSYGALAAKFVASGAPADGASLTWNTALGTVTNWYGRFYVYRTGTPLEFPIVRMSVASSCNVFIRDDGTMYASDTGGQAVNFSTAMALNAWARVEWHLVHSTTVGQWEVRLFTVADSPSPTESQTSAANRNTGTDTNLITYGTGAAASYTGPFWMDHLVAGASDWPGPAQLPTFLPFQPSSAVRW